MPQPPVQACGHSTERCHCGPSHTTHLASSPSRLSRMHSGHWPACLPACLLGPVRGQQAQRHRCPACRLRNRELAPPLPGTHRLCSASCSHGAFASVGRAREDQPVRSPSGPQSHGLAPRPPSWLSPSQCIPATQHGATLRPLRLPDHPSPRMGCPWLAFSSLWPSACHTAGGC